MKLEMKLAITFLIAVCLITTLEYWLDLNDFFDLVLWIVLFLSFVCLLFTLMINGIKHSKSLKLKAFLPVIILISSIYFESLLTDFYIWSDWKLNYHNRLKAIEFIQSSNVEGTSIDIPKGIGYVSRNRNKVWVQYDYQKKLTARFLIKEGIMGGVLPDIFLVYKEDSTNKINIGQKINRMDRNWIVEIMNN